MHNIKSMIFYNFRISIPANFIIQNNKQWSLIPDRDFAKPGRIKILIKYLKLYNIIIKGALLVAPSDTAADTFPTGTKGFSPVPLIKLPFKSITVASNNDFYVTTERAGLFADSWGSKLINIGDAGHINVVSGMG